MVEVVIPVYKPGNTFIRLLSRLQKQTVKPRRILLMHTVDTEEKEEWENFAALQPNVEVVPVQKKDFDHGGTRNIGAFLTNSEFILFMTQDAVPYDDKLIEELLKPMTDANVAASYAKQMPKKETGTIERYTRRFNYPSISKKKTVNDLSTMGIKTYFCSNVCAMYRREVFHKLGGFVNETIFNEDMIMAHTVITAGYAVYYAADAKVRHSHKYTNLEQFKRNFDMAVSHKQYTEVFGQVPPESEGVKLVKDTAKYLLRKGKAYLIPNLIIMSAFKYLGYRIGLQYKRIPIQFVKKLSMNPAYWEK